MPRPCGRCSRESEGLRQRKERTDERRQSGGWRTDHTGPFDPQERVRAGCKKGEKT